MANGSHGAVRLVEEAQIGECGEMHGEVPRWLRPGGWARAVAGQALDAGVFGLDDPCPLPEIHVLAFEP
eukprot:7674186-Pyramimonas_sp.AAC.1